MCTNIQKKLTKLFFRAGNMYSALSSMTFGSLLGMDCRIFCKLNECSSHMMPCVFYVTWLLKINMVPKCIAKYGTLYSKIF